MTSQRPTSFAEFADILDSMPVILLNVRRARGVSQREAATQAGMSFSTISRMESGEEFTSTSLRAILVWLEKSP